MNQTILEYVRPDREMFIGAQEEIEAFEEQFELQEVEELEGAAREKKRIYWKDLIAREE